MKKRSIFTAAALAALVCPLVWPSATRAQKHRTDREAEIILSFSVCK